MTAQNKGLISSIESYTVHDGPGCRTTIFMAGCPLQCEWCANPETWDLRQKILYTAQKCQSGNGCTRCLDGCPHSALEYQDGKLAIDWRKCKHCKTFDCTMVCHTEALRVCGKWYSEEQLMERINLDRDFWGSDGGITFSGGEPFSQPEFIKAILTRCTQRYIHTAIETSAYTDCTTFLDIMQLIDFAFIDIKHMDTALHKQKTGVDNIPVLENIKVLVNSGWAGRLVLRTPVIESYNDSTENMAASAAFMQSVGLREINLLPFHRLGESKWQQLERRYQYQSCNPTSEEKMAELQSVFENAGLLCYVGTNTPF
ncbi:MAG TPA: 4-hydroxyphenylacetate decarboxylase activase [Desulfosporosinus sp.]|nr:4-hydroxyphenylacetate decarboxylase activase [Desulfosporosinus sp.]